jgi:hypothetical protein
MKIKVKEIKDVRYVRVNAAVRYDDEDMPFDAPMRDGKSWIAMIDLEKRRVLNWPQGKTLEFSMKVCDEGVYELLTADLDVIKKIDGYVPNQLLPGEYGDYLELKIDENGIITNWLPNANLSNFEDADE